MKFSFIFCGKTTFLCRHKDCIVTYQRLSSFMASFTYLRLLVTRLSMGLNLFLIPLVLRYKVTSKSRFYQTWFLAFWVVIYFVGGCLTTLSRGLHHHHYILYEFTLLFINLSSSFFFLITFVYILILESSLL